ncbi:MAG: hypothetical protein OEW67_08235 [Cyclobacteriaceae bacterium]|nr:hypothetical protein [Cyclobacteriaceae bacterium]
MDYKRIEDLLEKYWACETSIVEEKELRTFFKNEPVPEQFKDTALLFQYFETQSRQKKLGTDFDQKILAQLNEEASTKKTKMVHLFNNYYKVAAVIIMVIVLSLLVTRTIQQEQDKVQMADTFENPEDAFEETKKALLLISNKIGKGKTQMVKLSEFNKAEEKIKNNNVEL